MKSRTRHNKLQDSPYRRRCKTEYACLDMRFGALQRFSQGRGKRCGNTSSSDAGTSSSSTSRSRSRGGSRGGSRSRSRGGGGIATRRIRRRRSSAAVEFLGGRAGAASELMLAQLGQWQAHMQYASNGHTPSQLDSRLQGLLGAWLGRDGTQYDLTEDTPASLTVATIRPNGQSRTTRGLVSTELDALVRWGRRGQYYLEESGLPFSAVWCEARCLGSNAMPTKHVVFEWSRPANEESEARRDSSCPPVRGFGCRDRNQYRQSEIDEVKRTSYCHNCGRRGHWQGDPECHRRGRW